MSNCRKVAQAAEDLRGKNCAGERHVLQEWQNEVVAEAWEAAQEARLAVAWTACDSVRGTFAGSNCSALLADELVFAPH